MNQDPKDSKESPLYAPGTQVLIKVWEDGSPKAQLQPTWKGPYPVILSTPTAVKVPGHDSWTHYSQVKPWEKTEEDTQYTCEPLGDLRYLFRLQMSAILMNTPKINTPVSPWESSDTYSGLPMSDILMNTPKTWFLVIRFLRIALKSQPSLTEIVFQNRQETDLLIPEQGGT